MKAITLNETLELKGSYDVIVAGGGVAGAAAALSVARRGKSVLLIEKAICLGGLATIGLVNMFVSMCNGRGKQIIKGMADEFLRLSYQHGYDNLPEAWQSGAHEITENTNERLVTRYSAPIFALELTKLLHESGVKLLFDTVVTRPVMDGNICKGLVVENKSGREYYEGKMIIDTTGDADVLYRAGVPTVQGKNYHTFVGEGLTLETCRRAIEHEDVSQLLVYFYGGDSNSFGNTHPDDVEYYLGTNAEDINRYVITNHIEMLEKISGDDRKKRDIHAIPTMCQFRTTRHIDGNYVLKESDKYQHKSDSIGTICDFMKRDDVYEVPYGTLVKDGYDNLITAGRTAAAEDYAWEVLRVIPPAILTGQAAGEACVIALEDGVGICDINIAKLQERVAATGVDIHIDESLIPDDKSGGEKTDIGHI